MGSAKRRVQKEDRVGKRNGKRLREKLERKRKCIFSFNNLTVERGNKERNEEKESKDK